MEDHGKCAHRTKEVDAMIEEQVLKKLAREWKLKVEDVEKYYILGWILYGISKSTIGKKIVFKGGTAISKVYFPSDWRLSEDLDFTSPDEVDWNTVIDALEKEIPKIIQKESGISLRRKPRDIPHTNVGYLQYKMGYTGPLFSGMIKIEVTKETFLGKVVTKPIPNDPSDFDYPEFSLQVYSLETIIGEKIRAILQRGYIRDYYDVWRLLKENRFELDEAKNMFDKKCKAKGIKFSNIDDFFPNGIVDTLKEHLPNLMRLTREPLPTIEELIRESRELLEKFLS